MFNQERITQLEIQAKDGESVPEDLTTAEKVLFSRFRCLYFILRNNGIDRESAKQEKQDILKEFESFSLAEITAYNEADIVNEVRRLVAQNYRAMSKFDLIKQIDSIRDVAMRNVF